MTTPDRQFDCIVAGCGPAGAMLGLLLARAGCSVLVLEKHGDFLRDFRGDTIHPSTLEILDQIGLAGRFLELPHTRLHELTLPGGGKSIRVSLDRLPTKYPYIAMAPQWDFLNFITAEAQCYPGFHLLMNAEVTGLAMEGDTVRGIRYRTADGEHTALAPVTVGTDGRSSVTRAAAGLQPIDNGSPIDVFWFRLSRRPDEPAALLGRRKDGRFGVQINRGDYWQIATIIPKGNADAVRAEGLDVFRRGVAELMPELADRVDEIQDWDQVKLLTVQSNRLRRWWKPGYLAIGDAAHAMSPAGGVGVNLAIQDAVETANVLWRPLREGTVTTADLATIQRRREWPTRIIQTVQNRLLQFMNVPPPGEGGGAPPIGDLLIRIPRVRDILPRFIALGVGRPRVTSPEIAPGRQLPAIGESAETPDGLSMALGALFLGAGVLHVVFHDAFEEVVPEPASAVRRPLSAATGVLQLVAGISFFVPRLRTVARWSALAVLIPGIPAALDQARHPETAARATRLPAWLIPVRIPLQAAVTVLSWWATRPRR